MSRDAFPAPEGARNDEHEADAVSELLREDPSLASATEALVADLDAEALPEGGWANLRARLSARVGGTATGETPAAGSPLAGGAGGGSAPPPQVARSPVSSLSWAVGLVLAAAVVVAGSWGALKAGEAAQLRDDQRILAYWMANPEMRLISLRGPGDTAGASSRLGILCVLPDGRALLLQPNAAPRGSTYVVVGGSDAGSRELVRGRGNMLEFNATGLQEIEVVLARGDNAGEIVAHASLD